MQPDFTDYPNQEHQSEIFIRLLDETYDKQFSSEESENLEREEFVASISSEFKSEFVEVDIGPGASLPAFLTILSEHYIISILGASLLCFFLANQFLRT